MNRLLVLISLLFISIASSSQAGYLFVKNGAKKKKTYLEGDRIMMQLNDGSVVNGLITLLLNDTIYLNGRPIPRKSVDAVLLSTKKKNKFPASTKTLLLIGGGAALTTVGLTINNRESFKKASIAALVIGYAPLIVKFLGKGLLMSLQRRRYRIGKKYQLQVLEFHLPNKRAF